MKAKYAIVIAGALAMLSPSCARRGNNPSDVQAIRDSVAAWDKAWNAGDCDSLVSFYTVDAVAMGPNAPATVGRDALRSSCKKDMNQFREENHSLVEDVRTFGNLAAARGTQEAVTTPKAGGSSVRDKEKWIAVFERQADGSWKVLWETYNSDLPQFASDPRR